MNMYASFTDIVNVYTVVGGLAFVLLSYMHGLMFISLKTDRYTTGTCSEAAEKSILPAAVIVLFVILTGVYTDAFTEKGAILIPLYAVAIVLLLTTLPIIEEEKRRLQLCYNRVHYHSCNSIYLYQSYFQM